VNCYFVALDRDDIPYLWVTEIDGDRLIGLIWDGNSYSKETKISIGRLDDYQLNITHYCGLLEVSYSSIYDFSWNYFTRIIYIKIQLINHIDSFSQYFFNKKKLVTKKRMDLLRFMMNDQLDRDHDYINKRDLMTKIYTIRLFLHPSRDAQKKKLKLYLESLIESGELREINNGYVVTGVAISTIERYEEEERRHTEAVKLQRKMFWLALAALIFAVAQTGMVKLPTLIDLTSKDGLNKAHNKSN